MQLDYQIIVDLCLIALIIIFLVVFAIFDFLQTYQKMKALELSHKPVDPDCYTRRQYYRDSLLEITDDSLMACEKSAIQRFFKLSYQILWDVLGNSLDEPIGRDEHVV